MNKEGEITELDMHEKAGIALKEFPDGSAELQIFVHDEEEHTKISRGNLIHTKRG